MDEWPLYIDEVLTEYRGDCEGVLLRERDSGINIDLFHGMNIFKTLHVWKTHIGHDRVENV